jgi:hypothetical protein
MFNNLLLKYTKKVGHCFTIFTRCKIGGFLHLLLRSGRNCTPRIVDWLITKRSLPLFRIKHNVSSLYFLGRILIYLRYPLNKYTRKKIGVLPHGEMNEIWEGIEPFKHDVPTQLTYNVKPRWPSYQNTHAKVVTNVENMLPSW